MRSSELLGVVLRRRLGASESVQQGTAGGGCSGRQRAQGEAVGRQHGRTRLPATRSGRDTYATHTLAASAWRGDSRPATVMCMAPPPPCLTSAPEAAPPAASALPRGSNSRSSPVFLSTLSCVQCTASLITVSRALRSSPPRSSALTRCMAMAREASTARSMAEVSSSSSSKAPVRASRLESFCGGKIAAAASLAVLASSAAAEPVVPPLTAGAASLSAIQIARDASHAASMEATSASRAAAHSAAIAASAVSVTLVSSEKFSCSKSFWICTFFERLCATCS